MTEVSKSRDECTMISSIMSSKEFGINRDSKQSTQLELELVGMIGMKRCRRIRQMRSLPRSLARLLALANAPRLSSRHLSRLLRRRRRKRGAAPLSQSSIWVDHAVIAQEERKRGSLLSRLSELGGCTQWKSPDNVTDQNGHKARIIAWKFKVAISKELS